MPNHTNHQSTASSLPAELLCAIFDFLESIDPPFQMPQGRSKDGYRASLDTPNDSTPNVPPKGSMLGWIYVTHVCKRWRNIALGYPDLWSRPCLTDLVPLWAPLVIERSAGILLDVSFKLDQDGYAPDPGPTFRSWLTDALRNRIRSLALQCPLWHYDFDPFEDVKLSQLTTLFITDGTYPDEYVKRIERVRLWAKNTPMLSKLTLQNATVHWTPEFFSNITELSISLSYDSEIRHPPTVQELQAVVEAMKHLVKLNLSNVFETHSEDPPEPLPNVTRLPECLQSATFVDTIDPDGTFAIFLMSLDFCESTTISIKIQVTGDVIKCDWMTGLICKLSQISGAPCAALICWECENKTVSLSLYRRCASQPIENLIMLPGVLNEQPYLSLMVEGLNNRGSLSKFMERLFGTLKLKSLVTLRIKMDAPNIFPDYVLEHALELASKHLFEAAPDIRLLVITDILFRGGCIFRHMAKQITKNTYVGARFFKEAPAATDMYLPKLETLVIRDRYTGRYAKLALFALDRYLEARRERNCPIENVRLSIEDLDETALAIIKELPTLARLVSAKEGDARRAC